MRLFNGRNRVVEGQRGEAGAINQSPPGLEFGNALASGSQLLLQLAVTSLQLLDGGLQSSIAVVGAMTVAAADFDRVSWHGRHCAAERRSHAREDDDDDII